MKRKSLPLLLLCVVCGCDDIYSSRVVSSNELPGNYVAEYQFGREELVMRADCAFVQSVTLRGRTNVASATGTWKFDTKSQMITFFNLLPVRNLYDNFNPLFSEQTNSLTVHRVGTLNGIIVIGLDPDKEGYRYKKMEDARR
jgi:hypothetical protein